MPHQLKKRWIRLLAGRTWIFSVLLAALPSSAFAQEGAAIVAALEENFVKIIAEAENSVVSIARRPQQPPLPRDRNGERFADDPPPPPVPPSEFGGGIVFSPADQPGNNYILTMFHVVKGGHVAGRRRDNSDDLTIHTKNRETADVEIIAADPRSDLAVLQIREGQSLKPEDLKPIRFVKSPVYRKGQFVITLGNPYAVARDGSACAGWGMLSNIARKPQFVESDPLETRRRNEESLHQLGTLLQIDGQLNLGTSGGAVLNRKGELIGIVTAMAALEGYEKSMGYAVPLNAGMMRVITELAHGYEVDYGLLGIAPQTKPFPQGPQPTAVSVENTWPNSPASKAGIKLHDLILGINGETIYSHEDLMREVALIGPGNPARVELYRPATGQRLTRTVTLTKWPVKDDQDIIATKHRYEWNEITVDYATARLSNLTPEYPSAVLVTGVHDRALAKQTELRVGDLITHVDSRPVATPDDFAAVVRGKTSGTVKLRLLDRTVTVPVK